MFWLWSGNAKIGLINAPNWGRDDHKSSHVDSIINLVINRKLEIEHELSNQRNKKGRILFTR